MKSCEGRIGRVFVIRLEDGNVIPDCIEEFALEHNISVGQVILIGGIGSGEIVTGPRSSEAMPPDPILLPVDGAHEVAGIGVLAPDENKKPVLHIHASLGRAGKSVTGCLRPGVTAWLVGEVVIYEILGAEVIRKMDQDSGFVLLDVM